MHIEDTEILEVKLLHPTLHEDSRGFFYEAYSDDVLRENGINFSVAQKSKQKKIKLKG